MPQVDYTSIIQTLGNPNINKAKNGHVTALPYFMGIDGHGNVCKIVIGTNRDPKSPDGNYHLMIQRQFEKAGGISFDKAPIGVADADWPKVRDEIIALRRKQSAAKNKEMGLGDVGKSDLDKAVKQFAEKINENHGLKKNV